MSSALRRSRTTIALGASAAALLLRLAGTLALPGLLAHAVDAALRTPGSATGPASYLAGGLLLTGLSDVLVSVTSTYAVTLGTARLRVVLVQHLLAVGSRSRPETGDAVSRVVRSAADAAAAPAAVVAAVIGLAGSIAATALIWVNDWRSGAAFTGLAPLVVVIARRPLKSLADQQRGYLAAQSAVASRLIGALAGSRTIRAAGTVEQEIDRILVPLTGMSAAGRALWAAQRSLSFRVRIVIGLVQIGTLAAAGYSLAAGQLSPGGLLAVVGLVTLALAGIDRIDTVVGLVISAASRSRVGDALSLPARPVGTATLPAGPVGVTWRGVTVGDGDGGLSGIDLHLPAGSSLALVGASGSGKSLLAATVGGLVQPDHGEVLLNGIAVRDLDPDVLHAAVSFAFDAPVLLGATVAESIAYPHEAQQSRVREAARLARADSFLQRLPAGYDTDVECAPMSGGELQRVGLARAFAADTPVMVFDDATSGLDALTEAEIRQVITASSPGRTRLLAVHHADTAASCDQVAWLDGGRVRAVGSHRQLWADPEYRRLFGHTSVTGIML